MVSRFDIRLTLFSLLMLGSCNTIDDTIDVGQAPAVDTHVSSTIAPVCVVENSDKAPLSRGRLSSRSLIDQITAKEMEANFLRIDEDIDAESRGLYTYTGDEAATPYAINWNKAYVLEGRVASTPDNTDGIHYRSVSLSPVQSYKYHIVTLENDTKDTVQFYHTRMVGWYPRTCEARNNDGVAANVQFDYQAFDAVRCNDVITDEGGNQREVVGIKFSGLDGSQDLMVSDLCEAQHWHKYNEEDPHTSDVHPTTSENIYRTPFGHSISAPAYTNHFTFRHYHSAIRVFAYADQSPQNLAMWGDIEHVTLHNQPTSCKISLPERIGEFGDVYEWGDYDHRELVSTPIFGNDENHADMNLTANFPISLVGSMPDHESYLGYALIQPDKGIDIELHTTSGVYSVHISNNYEMGDGSMVEIFKEGYIYDIHLDLKTNGAIAAILEQSDNEHYFDLTRLTEFDTENLEDNNGTVSVYKYANCYIVDPEAHKRMEDGQEYYYDGYCFDATVVGNGESGIIQSGAQTMYPTTATIKPQSARLMWESKLGLVSQIELVFGYVRFKVDRSQRGNAVIAVFDKDKKVLWSWHIWVTDTPEDKVFKVNATEYAILDRNLGATAATWTGAGDVLDTYGLYYQWGRKDPSMGPPAYNYSPINLITAPYYDYSSDEHTAAEVVQFAYPTLQNGVENPMYLVLPTNQTQSYLFNWTYTKYDFLWGYDTQHGTTDKTIYDPCPFGYRVSGGELGTIFSYIDGTESTELNDYGQIRHVPAVAKSGGEMVDIWFPYTGYKGVDRGLNSLVCSWRYVGEKTDLTSSIVSTTTGVNYMHRARIYLSKASAWSELNVGNYQGHTITDYTNRRTAAPVRCVKSTGVGRVVAEITADHETALPGTTIKLNLSARSFESRLSHISLVVRYRRINGDGTETIIDEKLFDSKIDGATLGLQWKNTLEWTVPSAAEVEQTTKTFRFMLNVQNELGVSRTISTNVGVANHVLDFTHWDNQTAAEEALRQPIIGQQLNRFVRIYGNSRPTKVMINGVDVTSSITSIATGPYAYNAYYGIGINGHGDFQSTGELTFSTPGWKTITVEAHFENGEVLTDTRRIGVYGLNYTQKSDNTFDTSKYYTICNTATGRYIYDNGTYLGTQTSATPTFYHLFTVSGTGMSQTFRNVSTNEYCRDYNGTILADRIDESTTYTLSRSNSSYSIYVSVRSGWRTTTYYWKDNNSEVVGQSGNSGNRYWYIYEVTLVHPDEY